MKENSISSIEIAENKIDIKSGIINRIIDIKSSNIRIKELKINNKNILESTSDDMSIEFSLAEPDELPKGIEFNSNAEITQKNSDQNNTDGLDISGDNNASYQSIKWINKISLKSSNWNKYVNKLMMENSTNTKFSKILILNAEISANNYLKNVIIKISYEIYDNYPVIRKWIEIKNNGKHWIKINDLNIDNIIISNEYSTKINFTPSERGAVASILSFSNKNKSEGLIFGSEIPSALRKITKSGIMGYNSKNFEFVLGPNEKFVSEPIFHFAFSGDVVKTISSVSTPLDRIVESQFQKFLREIIQVRAIPEKMPAPLWCTWSNFVANINDQIIREQADLANRCGFTGFQIDAGWSESMDDSDWTCGSKIPHHKKFPDFKLTCEYVKNLGLKLGLWLSCFRNKYSPDLKDLPHAFSLPKVIRGEGIGMSYASEWKEYYANDILYLNDKYGASYFKQDLTNIKFGDIAEGHESRTRTESKLRAIRGFFESQDIIHEKAPNVCTLLSHEIYWGTPGVPCDLAAIKHCWSFHIPPNDYSGCGNRRERVEKQPVKRFSKYKIELLLGCKHARFRNYAHRGLPLYTIEYYGAATVNIDGSLTKQVQDRQICSWLMGIPSVYAGDLSSLTEENINHYKKRFDLIKKLQDRYNIYKYFQFSGVPSPTDLNWHWWGKLNEDKEGIVIVIRGLFGKKNRQINIPWIDPNTTYSVKTLLSTQIESKLLGRDLIDGNLRIKLPRFGQDIIELNKISN